MPDDNVFDPTTMNILQDVNFDPIAILKGDVKLDSTTPIVKTGASAGDEGDDPADKKTAAAANPPKQTIDLSDDMLQAGLKKTSSGDSGGDPDLQGKDDPAKPPVVGGDDKTNALAVHYKLMTESGEWDPIDDFDGSEAKYIEARQINDEKRAIGMTESWFTEAFAQNPEGAQMGKQLFNHLRNGGKVADFVELMAPTEFDFKGIESDDEVVAENAAKEMIRRYYSAIGWKSDKINARITDRAKTGQLVDEAKQIEEPYKDLLELQNKGEAQRLAANRQNQQRAAQQINNELISMLDKNEGFGGIKLYTNKKERQEMESYIFAPDPETKTTEFNAELNKELRNPKFLMYLATSLKHKLYDNPAAFKGDAGADAGNAALKSIKNTLEGALLNKDISKVGNSAGQNNSDNNNRGKFQFDLDNAVVIS